MTDPRPLGNNVIHALEDIDELVTANQRLLNVALKALLAGDLERANLFLVEAIENQLLSGRIALLLRTGEFDQAARVWPEAQMKRGVQP